MSEGGTKSGAPVNLLGLVARWRGGELRDSALPGVPWTAGEIGDALAPILRGRETTSGEIASVAGRGLDNPGSLSTEEIVMVCASALTQAKNRSSRG